MSNHNDRKDGEFRGITERLGRDTKDVAKNVKKGLNRFIGGALSGNSKNNIEIVKPDGQRREDERKLSEERELKDAQEKIVRLKTECWERHKAYIGAEYKYREYREQFSKDGGILNYIQRFIGLAEYDLNDFSDMEQLKLKCCDQIISGLSNCIQYQLNDKNNNTSASRPVDMNEEAFFANMDIDYNSNLTLDACSQIIDTLIKKLEFQESNLSQLRKEFNNYYYKNLWNAVKTDLQGLLTLNAERFDSVDNLKAVIRRKADEIKDNFNKNGIDFIFFDDCTEEINRDKYFIILDSCDRVPAVIRKEDNFIYFRGKYMIP